MIITLKTDYVQLWFLYKSEYRISTTGKQRQYLPHYWSDKGFKGTVVNKKLQCLQGGSLEITFIVSLKEKPS